MKDIKRTYGYRKTKAFGLCAAALGAFVVAGGNVSADEVTEPAATPVVRTENPATNLPEAQGNASAAATETQAKAGEKEGTLDINVDNSKVEAAAKEAQANGITVEKGETKNLGTATNDEELAAKEAELKADQDKQVEKLNEAKDSYLTKTKEYEDEKARIEKANKDAKDEYERKLAEINEALDNTTGPVTPEYTKTSADGTKVLPSGAWENLGSKELDGGKIKVLGTGTVTKFDDMKEGGSYKVNIKAPEVDDKHIIKSIQWGDVAPDQNDTLTTTEKQVNNVGDGYYWQTDSFTRKYSVKSGTWFRIADAVTLKDGSKSDLWVKLTKGRGNRPGEFIRANDILGYDEYITFWNTNGAINYLNGYGSPNDPLHTFMEAEYRLGNATDLNEDKFLWSNAITDIDGGQHLFLDGDSQIVGIGGGLRYEESGDKKHVVSDKNLGFYYGNNKNEIQGLAGTLSTPDGTASYVTYGTGFHKFLQNGTGVDASLVADSDFGNAININAVNPPTYEVLNVEPPKPGSVTVHDYKLSNTVVNTKEVKNQDKEDIDGKLVAKGSDVNWELKNESLKANRDKTDKYVIVDPLPTGFEFDEEETKAKSPDYDVTYDKETHTVTFTMKAESLDKLNAELTAAAEIPVPVINGRVLNDGATYKNGFTTTITPNEGTPYVVTSNIPEVYTPGNDPKKPRKTPKGEDPTPKDNLIVPEKENRDKDGVNINGKTMFQGSTNYYRLKWDLDQYSGMKASKEDIAKGFFYVDDYPEEAVNIHNEQAKIHDAQGNEISGITVTSYESFDKATAEVQAMLERAGLKSKINGAFQLFTADNPEDFYNKYVVTGTNLYITTPMDVKKELTEGSKYVNKPFQIDFGNGYEGNPVENEVPGLKPEKTVEVNGENRDNSVINLGEQFNYRLIGAYIPGNRADALFEYKFIDDYQESHDEYKGYTVTTKVDITLKDGTVIKAGTDVTKYVNSAHDAKDGKIEISFKKEFLNTVSNDSEFQSEVSLTMVRINYGDVENKYTNVVNGIEVVSNTVKTTTPPPATPQEPQLPNTGSADGSILQILGGLFLSLGAALGFTKKKEA